MSEKSLAEFSLEDGTNVLVEVDESGSSAVERVSITSGQLVLRATKSLEEALENLVPFANNAMCN